MQAFQLPCTPLACAEGFLTDWHGKKYLTMHRTYCLQAGVPVKGPIPAHAGTNPDAQSGQVSPTHCCIPFFLLFKVTNLQH